MIITTGIKPDEVDTAVIWQNAAGNWIAQASWSLGDAISYSYRTVVSASRAEVPELEATLKLTESLLLSAKLMRMAFAPTEDQMEEIRSRVSSRW